ncbi:MAG: enoyl-CoA hydratase/isomerase family protein [Gemmatimonadales bacterium]|nr:enoyl-CoA hydratase/isomerase family protein [Gemmatimonadales bacterium]
MAVRQEASGRVLIITLDNPAVKNAFDAETIGELRGIFESIAFRDPLPTDSGAEPEIGEGQHFRPHVVVLRATGDVFCAGAHLGMMKKLGKADYQENVAAALDMGAMFRAVRNCPVPVVARVQGPAYGGGVGLVASCDIVVAGQQAKFAFSEVRLGLIPGVIAPLVMDRIGLAATRTCFLTAETIDSVEALRIGLVDRLADGRTENNTLDNLLDRTVDSLLKGGPSSLGLCKNLIEGVNSLGFARSGELAARMIAEARQSDEAQVALEAFQKKLSVPWNQERKST